MKYDIKEFHKSEIMAGDVILWHDGSLKQFVSKILLTIHLWVCVYLVTVLCLVTRKLKKLLT